VQSTFFLANPSTGSCRPLSLDVTQANAKRQGLLTQGSYRTLHLLCDLRHGCPRLRVRPEFSHVACRIFTTNGLLRFLCHLLFSFRLVASMLRKTRFKMAMMRQCFLYQPNPARLPCLAIDVLAQPAVGGEIIERNVLCRDL